MARSLLLVILKCYMGAEMSKKKPWNKFKFTYRRNFDLKNKRRKILIVCEGEKTEPNYFKSFPIDNKNWAVEIHGEGKSIDYIPSVDSYVIDPIYPD